MNPPDMHPHHRLQRMRAALPAVVLLCVIGAGLVSALLSALGSSSASPLISPVSPSSIVSLWRDRTARDALAKTLTATPLVEHLAALQRASSWVLLHDLGPAVLQGSDGWLFLADELAVHPHHLANGELRADGVIRIARMLAAQHVALIVAVVPDKSRIEQRHLGPIVLPPTLQPRVSTWTAALAKGGVMSIDLTEALHRQQADTFLKTDTHWNERGSRTAAQVIAARLMAMGLDLGPAVSATAGASSPVEETGDLIHLAGLDGLPATLRPKDESVQHTVVDVQTNNDDLFGEQSVPSIVLVGTSYSRRSNFASFLQMDSHALIANFAVDGGDFSGAMRRYLAGDAFRDHPPRLIIWELAERMIDAPLAQTERAWLATPSTASTAAASTASIATATAVSTAAPR